MVYNLLLRDYEIEMLVYSSEHKPKPDIMSRWYCDVCGAETSKHYHQYHFAPDGHAFEDMVRHRIRSFYHMCQKCNRKHRRETIQANGETER